MKILSLLLGSFMSFSAFGYQSIDLSPLQLQFRFEDTSAQSKETVTYESYSGNYQRDWLRLGLSFAQHSDSTGNASLRIENIKKEYLTNWGYQIFSLQGKTDNLRLDIFVEGLVGMTQSQVSTTLLGSTTSSTSNNDLVYGLGAAAIGRYSYFLIEADFQMLGSKAFAPQYVPVVTIKAGVTIPFP